LRVSEGGESSDGIIATGNTVETVSRTDASSDTCKVFGHEFPGEGVAFWRVIDCWTCNYRRAALCGLGLGHCGLVRGWTTSEGVNGLSLRLGEQEILDSHDIDMTDTGRMPDDGASAQHWACRKRWDRI